MGKHPENIHYDFSLHYNQLQLDIEKKQPLQQQVDLSMSDFELIEEAKKFMLL